MPAVPGVDSAHAELSTSATGVDRRGAAGQFVPAVVEGRATAAGYRVDAGESADDAGAQHCGRRGGSCGCRASDVGARFDSRLVYVRWILADAEGAAGGHVGVLGIVWGGQPGP